MPGVKCKRRKPTRKRPKSRSPRRWRTYASHVYASVPARLSSWKLLTRYRCSRPLEKPPCARRRVLISLSSACTTPRVIASDPERNEYHEEGRRIRRAHSGFDRLWVRRLIIIVSVIGNDVDACLLVRRFHD